MWFYLVAVLPCSLDEMLAVAVALSRPLLEHLHCLVVTLGANGVLLCGEHDAGTVSLQPRKQKRVRTAFLTAHNDLLTAICFNSSGFWGFCLQKRQLCALHYPALAVTPEEIMNVSGAGDRCYVSSARVLSTFNFP